MHFGRWFSLACFGDCAVQLYNLAQHSRASQPCGCMLQRDNLLCASGCSGSVGDNSLSRVCWEKHVLRNCPSLIFHLGLGNTTETVGFHFPVAPTLGQVMAQVCWNQRL